MFLSLPSSLSKKIDKTYFYKEGVLMAHLTEKPVSAASACFTAGPGLWRALLQVAQGVPTPWEEGPGLSLT